MAERMENPSPSRPHRGLPTALAGLVDYAAIPEGDRARKTAMVHLTVMLAAVGCFGVDLILRGGPAAPRGGQLTGTVVLHALGTLVLLTGGWLGGELVFRHGIAVERPREPSAAPAVDDANDRAARSARGGR